MRAARTFIALLLVAAVAGGCGSSGNEGLTSGQAQALMAQLKAARATAAAGDVEGTKTVLVKFRRSVARLRRDGALRDGTARSLRIGAARLLQRVESDSRAPLPSAPATPAQTATTPAPAPQPPGQKKKDEKKQKGEKKHGKQDD